MAVTRGDSIICCSKDAGDAGEHVKDAGDSVFVVNPSTAVCTIQKKQVHFTANLLNCTCEHCNNGVATENNKNKVLFRNSPFI